MDIDEAEWRFYSDGIDESRVTDSHRLLLDSSVWLDISVDCCTIHKDSHRDNLYLLSTIHDIVVIAHVVWRILGLD